MYKSTILAASALVFVTLARAFAAFGSKTGAITSLVVGGILLFSVFPMMISEHYRFKKESAERQREIKECDSEIDRVEQEINKFERENETT